MAWVAAFAALVLMCCCLCCAEANQVQSALFERLNGTGYNLAGHTLKVVSERSPVGCAGQCQLMPHCVSFALSPQLSDGTRTCDLKDISAVRSKWLEPQPGYSYFYLAPPRLQYLGCYHSIRVPLTLHTTKIRDDFMDWTDMYDDLRVMPAVCATVATRWGYDLVAMEYYGFCFFGNQHEVNMTTLMPSLSCIEGIGVEDIMGIYAIVQD